MPERAAVTYKTLTINTGMLERFVGGSQDGKPDMIADSCVGGGGRVYQNGGPLLANLSRRLSLFFDHLRTVLAVKGSLRRAQ